MAFYKNNCKVRTRSKFITFTSRNTQLHSLSVVHNTQEAECVGVHKSLEVEEGTEIYDGCAHFFK
jgi:hypothetical protein